MKSAHKRLLRKKYYIHQTKQVQNQTKLVSWLTLPHHWLRLFTCIHDSRLCQILSYSRMVTMLCVLIESKQNCIMWYTLCHRHKIKIVILNKLKTANQVLKSYLKTTWSVCWSRAGNKLCRASNDKKFGTSALRYWYYVLLGSFLTFICY